MKFKIALLSGLLSLAYSVSNADPVAILDDSLGLVSVSVFDAPAPEVFEYSALDPKEAGILPRAWDDAPPLVPHRVDKYLPIKAKVNECLDCHDEPKKIGKEVKGEPTPMKESHYVKSDAGKLSVSNKRYVCSLCHAPQTKADVLVGNTFRGDNAVTPAK